MSDFLLDGIEESQRTLYPASVVKQVLAFVVDAVIILIVISLFLGNVIDSLYTLEMEHYWLSYGGFYLLYSFLMEVSPKGGTIGDMAFRIRVVTSTNDKLGVGKALLRMFAKLATAITVGLGWLTGFMDAENRSLHDLIAKCKMVERMA